MSVLSLRCRMSRPLPAATAPTSVLVLRRVLPVAACRFRPTQSVKLLASVIGAKITKLVLQGMNGILVIALSFRLLVIVVN